MVSTKPCSGILSMSVREGSSSICQVALQELVKQEEVRLQTRMIDIYMSSSYHMTPDKTDSLTFHMLMGTRKLYFLDRDYHLRWWQFVRCRTMRVVWSTVVDASILQVAPKMCLSFRRLQAPIPHEIKIITTCFITTKKEGKELNYQRRTLKIIKLKEYWRFTYNTNTNPFHFLFWLLLNLVKEILVTLCGFRILELIEKSNVSLMQVKNKT